MLKTHEPVYQAIWVENTDFDEVLISPAMIQDHMPDTVLDALNKVSPLAQMCFASLTFYIVNTYVKSSFSFKFSQLLFMILIEFSFVSHLSRSR